MTERLYFEDCHVGDRVVSPGRTITETDILMFAALTGDWNAVHTDAEYARSTMFGERIAHGLLLLAIGGGLLVRGSEPFLVPQSLLALAGIEKVRFLTPAKIGTTVHLETEVTALTKVGATRGLITANHRMRDQSGQEVLTYTSKVLVGRRGAEADQGGKERR